MTANFDTKHLLEKLRSLFRKLYSTFCLCSYRLLRPIHLVPSCSTAQSLRPWVLRHSLLSILQRTPVMLDLMFNNNHTNFYCDKKTFMCSSSPTQSLGGSMEKASGNMSQVFCPPQPDKLSATLLVLWFAFCWSRSYTMSPTQFLTLFSRKAMNASFWYCRRCVTAIGSWSMNSEREMVKLL